MIKVILNHWDGSQSEANVSLDAKLLNLADTFCVESVEIVDVPPRN